jgi:hypothetical protein
MSSWWRIVISVSVSSSCGTNRTADSATKNGAVAPAELIADCRTCSATQGTTNRRIHGRIIGVRFNGRQQDC